MSGPNFASDFHQLSHDLRTPLNAINGYAELLLMDEALSQSHADYVRAILTGSEALRVAVTCPRGATSWHSQRVIEPRPPPTSRQRTSGARPRRPIRRLVTGSRRAASRSRRRRSSAPPWGNA